MRAVAEDGEARPTRILYGANLSSDRLGKYLDELVSKKLIDKRDGDDGTRYALTKEGRAFLVEFRRIEEFSSAFGIEF
jgi:predicted transcriptional regulator